MKTFLYSYKSFLINAILFAPLLFSAQTDSGKVNRVPADTSTMKLNMDAVYNRPFLQYGKSPVALGGYVEANSNYAVTDGIGSGLSFQIPRTTLFISSSLHRKIKFLSEIEFEDGTKEINIEFAALDIQFQHLFNFRSGIVMNPIGAFNQNHDGPRWEFVDRPISATRLLPATFSNVGFGFFGKSYKPGFVWAYELYFTNGFDNRIIGNEQNKTWLPATKLNPNRFEESSNGKPLTSAKTSLRLKKLGEIGVSYMGGIYNSFEVDALTLDKKRRVDVLAIDYTNSLSKSGTSITGEFAWILVDVPASYSQQYGQRQHGGFVDIVQPILKKQMFGFEKAVLNAAVRFEYVDWNVGRFRETGGNISDHVYAIVPALSFRTSPQTVLRLNYRYEWMTDLLGNPAARSAALQFGISSYF